MRVARSVADGLAESAAATDGLHPLPAVRQWLRRQQDGARYRIDRMPLAGLNDWSFDPATGDLGHRTGRFFTIRGLDVRTNFGSTRHWQQPIIDQPEIGILGFLIREFDDVPHLLVQAKIEPGNLGPVQLSPTLQATRSNFTRAHGGRAPDFLDAFLDCDPEDVVVDQLQSEQGSRFLRKRNRNTVVIVPPGDEAGVPDAFIWMTLGQLHALLAEPNLVNMDTRTVLSCLPQAPLRALRADPFAYRLAASLAAVEAGAQHSLGALRNFIARAKTDYELVTRTIPLAQVQGWQRSDADIARADGRYFRVVAVDVEIGEREVARWQQPLIASASGGINAFVCASLRGVLHFLVQARVEPGTFDIVELAPTVQMTPANYAGALPQFGDQVLDALACGGDRVQFDCAQSEEGGRFYHDANRYVVVEPPGAAALALPRNFAWMSLGQIKYLMQYANVFNVEARSLIACLATLQ